MSLIERASDVAWVDDQTRVVVLRLGHLADLPLVLEGSAAAIWRLLEVGTSQLTLVRIIADMFNLSSSEVEGDVNRFLDSAEQAGVISRMQSE